MTPKEAFEFADKLQYHYSQKESSNFIQATLLNYLGKEKYQKLCSLQRAEAEKLGKGPQKTFDEKSIFKPEFSEMNYPTESIIKDRNFAANWSLTSLMMLAKEAAFG